VDDLAARKSALRRQMLARRSEVSAQLAERVGQVIASAVTGTAAFREARRIALYAAARGEPSMVPLFRAALAAGKEVALPRCSDRSDLEFYRVRGREDLTRGRYGLLEPADRPGVERVDALDLVLVPGLAFDLAGQRLGRGGGYYDRTLAAFTGQGGLLLGAALHFQLVARVPAGDHDRPMGAIVTEEGMHWPPAGRVRSRGSEA
jgi:5-formyltetrahydrofolate cyclo-ligase